MARLDDDETRISVRGLSQDLADLVRRNLRDLRDDPELLADLQDRLINPEGRWIYELDKSGDRWSTFAALRKRYGAGPIVFDCEDAAGFVLAFLLLTSNVEVRAVVTRPRPDAILAHAYGVWRWKDGTGGESTQDRKWRVTDLCVFHGMPWPGTGFYGSGETYMSRVTWR